MLSFLLGEDDFSKKEYIKEQAQITGSETEYLSAQNEQPDILHLTEQNLFSKPKIFVLENVFEKMDIGESNLNKMISSLNRIVIVESSLDKRKTKNKEILQNKKIEVREFNLPHKSELNRWIIERVKKYGGLISNTAAEELAVRLGRDEGTETKFGGKVVEVREIFSLWQAQSEIQKLLALANGKEITKDDVARLVNENLETDSFEIANAIGDGDKNKTFFLISRFLESQSSADEKGGVIQLNALLAEQFRNVAMVQSFLSHKVSDDVILKKTAWKSGRLFVIKKIAKNFKEKKVLDFLNRLVALDEEVKTSSIPAKTILDLIIAQLF